jgi:hypothetical protein
MECPYCASELIHDDVFGRLAGFCDGKINGDIYRCPKGRAQDEDDECESSVFHVAGSFYAYREGNTDLQEGYPC